MAKALKTSNYADNLLERQFEAYGPGYVLLTDITYFFYGPEKKGFYLLLKMVLRNKYYLISFQTH